MSGVIVLSGLLYFFFLIVFSQIDYAVKVHHEYMIHRAMQYAIVESFNEESPQLVVDRFKTAFEATCPQVYEYDIRLMNFETNPKMVHFQVETSDGSFHMEEILIEEVKDAS